MVGRIYDFEGDVEELLDEVEKDILHVNESREQNEVQPMSTSSCNEALVTIENFFNRKGELSGIATGFADLDKMTDGLHGGEMIIVAARPSMGKTSLAMNIAEHVALELEPAGGRVQPGNERGVADFAHDVFAGAGEHAQHPRRLHERGGFSEADDGGGPAGGGEAVH